MDPLLRHILDISRDTPLSPQESAKIARRWPAFTLPGLMALKARIASPGEAARVAVALPDLDALQHIVGENADVLANFYPARMPETPSTMDTIDTFLATYGNPADATETDALTKAIFNPVPDYAAILAAEEQRSLPQGDELDAAVVGEDTAAINRFIASSKGRTVLPSDPAIEEEKEDTTAPSPQEQLPRNHATKRNPDTPAEKADHTRPNTPDSGNLSESFARIMIKNRNYTKALEIISDLSLKNPEKSIYFADQIRFLRKLIVNDNRNNKKQ